MDSLQEPTMDCQSPARSPRLLAVAACIAMQFLASAFATEPQSSATTSAPVAGSQSGAPLASASPVTTTVRAMRNDAALNGAHFVDANAGWAVGDRGVIWHTEDGGGTWSEQQSGVACHLSAVWFI